jgi:hypothetical protein
MGRFLKMPDESSNYKNRRNYYQILSCYPVKGFSVTSVVSRDFDQSLDC